MTKKKVKTILLVFFCIRILLPANFSNAQSNVPFIVKADQIKGPVQPTMWGIFFEDINLAADGGVYAELVKNRSFEFAAPMMGWKEQKREGGNGSVLVINRGSSNE